MSSPFGAWSGDTVKAWTFPPRQFLVDQWLYADDCPMLVGKEGIGKSTIFFQLLSALTTGNAFLGEYVVARPTVCLYVQLEGDKQETHRRLLAIEHTLGFDWQRFRYAFLPFQNLQTPDGQEVFYASLRPMLEPGMVVILDPFYALFPGSGSDDGVIKPVLASLRQFKEHYDLCLPIGHHIRKSTFDAKSGRFLEEGAEDALGSRLILGFVDTFFLMSAPNPHTRQIKAYKGRKGGYIESVTCRQQEVMLSPDESPVNLCRLHEDSVPAYHALLTWMLKQTMPVSYEQMAEIGGVKLITIQRWLKQSAVNTCIQRVNPGQRPAFFVHKLSPAASKLS